MIQSNETPTQSVISDKSYTDKSYKDKSYTDRAFMERSNTHKQEPFKIEDVVEEEEEEVKGDGSHTLNHFIASTQ